MLKALSGPGQGSLDPSPGEVLGVRESRLLCWLLEQQTFFTFLSHLVDTECAHGHQPQPEVWGPLREAGVQPPSKRLTRGARTEPCLWEEKAVGAGVREPCRGQGSVLGLTGQPRGCAACGIMQEGSHLVNCSVVTALNV